MRQSLIWVAIALLFVTACETVPENTVETEVGGAAVTNELPAINVQPQPITPVPTVVDANVPKPLDPETKEFFIVEVGDRIFFDLNSSAINERAQETLGQQAEWLRAYPTVQVTIEGHTDERGTREYNLGLGDRRANAVVAYLVALGVNKDRLKTVSWGKERPEALGSNQTAWALNRRAVTAITGGAPVN